MMTNTRCTRWLGRLSACAALGAFGLAAWAEEAAGGESGGIAGALGIDPKTIALQIFAFLLLLWLLSKFLWKPILALMDERRQEVASIYTSAEDAQAKAETARLDYEAKLAAADEEARERIARALAQANAMKDEVIASAREQSDRIILAGRESVRLEMEKAQVQIRDTATTMAVELAGRIIHQNIDANGQRALIDQFIEGAGGKQ